jgi:hypothetical protein
LFSFLDGDGTIALRLSPADRNEFIERCDASLHEAHGTVMREHVSVPVSFAEDTAQLAPWFERSQSYVATLKPKPTKRAR